MIHTLEYEPGLHHALEAATAAVLETRAALAAPEAPGSWGYPTFEGQLRGRERALRQVLEVAEGERTTDESLADLTAALDTLDRALGDARERREGEDEDLWPVHEERLAVEEGVIVMGDLIRLQVLREVGALAFLPVFFRTLGAAATVVFETVPAGGRMGRMNRCLAWSFDGDGFVATDLSRGRWMGESRPFVARGRLDRAGLITALARAGLAPGRYVECKRTSTTVTEMRDRVLARWRDRLAAAGYPGFDRGDRAPAGRVRAIG